MKKALSLIFVLFLINISLVQAQTAPANDNFANALDITLPYDGNTESFEFATVEASEPDHACSLASSSASVWYKFTIAANSTVTLSTFGSVVNTPSTNDLDTIMSVYSGTAINALTSVGCDDDNTGVDFSSRISQSFNAGTYYVQVSNASPDAPLSGSFIHLTVSAVASSVDVELLTNVSFEDHVVKPSQPDGWTAFPTVQDKLKCGLEEGDFSRTGLCSYRFVGGEEERAKLSQTPDITGLTFANGDELTARLFYDTNDVAPKLKVKVIITYTDTNVTPGKITGTIDQVSASDFTGIGFEPYVVLGPVTKIKFQLQNRATSGKIYIDDVSLIFTHQLAR